jgi:hypothetical protein
MLAGDGHTVIHSTRHSPIEFGKDVISIAPDGIVCAFQLKGNPGGRLSLKQLREIKGQLLELATQSIVHPDVPPSGVHRCYLVTNGEADEEVHRSLDDINRELEKLGYGKNRIHLWQRGRILEMANRLGAALWPTEIEDLNVFLELLVHSGDDILPLSKLHLLLSKVLCITEDDASNLGRDEANRRATSAAVMVGAALRNFSAAGNHYAAISAWTMFIAYWIAACCKHGLQINDRENASINLAKEAIRDSLAGLCDDIRNNERLLSQAGISIAQIHRGRATLIYALMSIYWLWSEEVGWLIEDHATFMSRWLPRDFSKSWLWGEGAVPQMLAHYWYISMIDPTSASESLLAALVSLVVTSTQRDRDLPSPYFSFEDVIRHLFSNFLKDPLRDESGAFASYSAQGLMHLLVRTNNKRTCAILWPEFTRLGLMHFEPDKEWKFCLFRSSKGRNITVYTKIPTTWHELIQDARECRVAQVPKELLREKYILLLFVIVFPHRATASIIRLLGRRFSKIWFIPPPIES